MLTPACQENVKTPRVLAHYVNYGNTRALRRHTTGYLRRVSTTPATVAAIESVRQ